MVFLIQNTQNRDAKAIQLKLDELLRGVQGARTGLVRLEELSDEELKELESSFERLRSREAPAGTGRRELGVPVHSSPSGSPVRICEAWWTTMRQRVPVLS
jgi:low affinity Fe/Cu permease